LGFGAAAAPGPGQQQAAAAAGLAAALRGSLGGGWVAASSAPSSGVSADLAELLMGPLSSRSLSSTLGLLGGSSRDSSAWSSLLKEVRRGEGSAAAASARFHRPSAGSAAARLSDGRWGEGDACGRSHGSP
jgi:hypothetical protein